MDALYNRLLWCIVLAPTHSWSGDSKRLVKQHPIEPNQGEPMGAPGYRDEPTPPWNPNAAVDPAQAEDFLRLCYAENPDLGQVTPRLDEVMEQITTTGTYEHTAEELAYGAKIAWRNSSRCIGRLYWRSLVVIDQRHIRTADGIFAQLVHHLEVAGGAVPATPAGESPERTGAGKARATISIFPPAVPGRPYPRVWNEQLIRYAGYRNEDGTITGDPRYVEFTDEMKARGWMGKNTAFDVLPLVIETPTDGVRLYELPEHAVQEISLVHPEFDWFANLELRWHAIPAISNMRLNIGGINYPLAPFNGWYMGTEIGSRNLGDAHRYDLVPTVARMMGLDTSDEATLWRDRALVEINRAVLWSFARAGVRISDHHTESHRFLRHVDREETAGRQIPADWTWIVPPLSGGATPVFHRYYDEVDQQPNFYLDPDAYVRGRRPSW